MHGRPDEPAQAEGDAGCQLAWLIFPEVSVTLLSGGQAPAEFGPVGVAFDFSQVGVEIDAFLLGQEVRAVAGDACASRLVAFGMLNGHLSPILSVIISSLP